MSNKYSPSKRNRIIKKTQGRCWYCGVSLIFDTHAHKHSFTIDHVIPPCQGGTNTDENLVAACRGCNSKKNNRNLSQYRLDLECQRFPEARMKRALLEALSESVSTPYNADLHLAIDWLGQQIEGVTFWGEILNQIALGGDK